MEHFYKALDLLDVLVFHKCKLVCKMVVFHRAYYLFEDEASANSYLKMHSARLKEMGVKKIRGRIFDVNVPLSTINKGPIA